MTPLEEELLVFQLPASRVQGWSRLTLALEANPAVGGKPCCKPYFNTEDREEMS